MSLHLSRACVALLVLMAGIAVADEASMEERVERIVLRLQSNEFATRESAVEEAGALPVEALPLLKARVDRPDLSAEVRFSLERVITRLGERAAGESVARRESEFIARSMQQAYERVGQRDPRWDASMQKLIAAGAGYVATIEDRFPEEDHAVTALLKEVEAAGCDDALVKYLRGMVRFPRESAPLAEAAAALVKQDYPPELASSAYIEAVSAKLREPFPQTKKPRAQMQQWVDEHLKLLPAILARADEQRFKTLSFSVEPLNMARWIGADVEQMYARFVAVYDAAGLAEDSLPRMVLEAGYRHALAARPNPDAQAAAGLVDAWTRAEERYPDNDGVATRRFLAIATFQPEDPRIGRAYERAFELNPGSARVCRAWLKHLLVEDPKAALRFGQLLVDRGDDRTIVPLIVAEAALAHGVLPELTDGLEDATLADKDVWRLVDAAYERVLRRNPDWSFCRSRRAALAWSGGHWARAKELLAEIGNDVDPRAFDGVDRLNWIRRELEWRTSPDYVKPDPVAGAEAKIAEDRALARQLLVDAYTAHGRRNAKWDTEALAFLKTACPQFISDPDAAGDESDIALEHAARAIEQGCDDPMVLLLREYLHLDNFGEKSSKPAHTLFDGMNRLIESDYPAGTKLYLCTWTTYLTMRLDTARDENDRLASKAFVQGHWPGMFEQLAKDRSLPASAARRQAVFYIYLTRTFDNDADTRPAYEAIVKWIEPVLKDKPGALLVVQAAVEWCDAQRIYPDLRKRQDQFKPAQLEPYHKAQRKVQDLLISAWEADRSDSYPIYFLIGSTKDLQQPRSCMEYWVRRGLEANEADDNVRDASMDYLDPRYAGKWDGYHKQMHWGERLAREGKDRYNASAWHWKGYVEYTKFNPNKPPLPEPAAKPLKEVWWVVEQHFESHLARRPRDHTARSEYALYASIAGKWSIANRQFALLGEHARVSKFGTRKRLDDFRAKAANAADDLVEE